MPDRVHWPELPSSVRAQVERRTGGVAAVESVSGGNNSQVALRITTRSGRALFVKGSAEGTPSVRYLIREATAGEVVPDGVAPTLRWTVRTGGWILLGFDFVVGRPADFGVRSADPDRLFESLTLLAEVAVPAVALPRAEDRWGRYLDDPAVRRAIRGETLCHTDFNPDNVIIDAERAILVDWAWATVGAPWLDLAIAPIWLIATGERSPAETEAWADRAPGWARVPRSVMAGFAAANLRLWDDIAADRATPWAHDLREAARHWSAQLSP